MVASQGEITQPTGATRPLVHARAPAWAVESEPLTRLETRTKESNVCVSLVEFKTTKRRETEGGDWRHCGGNVASSEVAGTPGV